jgi:hypothetical protein
MTDVNLGNLYDINKEAMKQFNPYDPIILNQKCKEIAEKIWNMNKPSYWMLLCRERNDYTVIRACWDYEELNAAIHDCLINRGFVINITEQEDGNFEIWLRDFDTNENVVYYLFDYNEAIVEV